MKFIPLKTLNLLADIILTSREDQHIKPLDHPRPVFFLSLYVFHLLQALETRTDVYFSLVFYTPEETTTQT